LNRNLFSFDKAGLFWPALVINQTNQISFSLNANPASTSSNRFRIVFMKKYEFAEREYNADNSTVAKNEHIRN
jgi:hypothetical protein